MFRYEWLLRITRRGEYSNRLGWERSGVGAGWGGMLLQVIHKGNSSVAPLRKHMHVPIGLRGATCAFRGSSRTQ